MTDRIPPRPELLSVYAEEIGALATIEKFIDDNISPRSIEIVKGELGGVVLWFLGGRSIKAFRAIKLLCEQGFGTEAVIIARTLLEALLSMRFIDEKESEKRASLYIDHDWKFREKFAHSTSELHDVVAKVSEEKWSENEQRIKDRAKAVKEEHGYTNSLGALCWTKETITALGDRFDLKFHVRAFYQMASQHAHVLVGSANEFMRQVEGGGFGWESGPGKSYVAETAVTACDLMISVIKILNGKFKFGLEDKIDALDASLAETLKAKKPAFNEASPADEEK